MKIRSLHAVNFQSSTGLLMYLPRSRDPGATISSSAVGVSPRVVRGQLNPEWARPLHPSSISLSTRRRRSAAARSEGSTDSSIVSSEHEKARESAHRGWTESTPAYVLFFSFGRSAAQPILASSVLGMRRSKEVLTGVGHSQCHHTSSA